jgi:hypothetical protein
MCADTTTCMGEAVHIGDDVRVRGVFSLHAIPSQLSLSTVPGGLAQYFVAVTSRRSYVRWGRQHQHISSRPAVCGKL